MTTTELKKMYPSLDMSLHLLMNNIDACIRYPIDPCSREWYNTVMSELSYREDRD